MKTKKQDTPRKALEKDEHDQDNTSHTLSREHTVFEFNIGKKEKKEEKKENKGDKRQTAITSLKLQKSSLGLETQSPGRKKASQTSISRIHDIKQSSKTTTPGPRTKMKKAKTARQRSFITPILLAALAFGVYLNKDTLLSQLDSKEGTRQRQVSSDGTSSSSTGKITLLNFDKYKQKVFIDGPKKIR